MAVCIECGILSSFVLSRDLYHKLFAPIKVKAKAKMMELLI